MKNKAAWELLPTVRTARIVLFACFFFSGLTGLLYEIVWVRLFGLVFGNTVYSTATVLAVFMGGLGLGGWWFGRFIEKRSDAVLFYGLVELGVGLYAFVPVLLIKFFETQYAALYRLTGGLLAAEVVFKAAAAVLILALPTFCMGATLPLLSRFFVRRRTRFGDAVSLLYGLNTLGAVTGTFLTGFFMVHTMGVRGTLFMGMVLNIGIGLLSLVQHRKLLDMDEEEEAQYVDEAAAAPEPEPEPDAEQQPASGVRSAALLALAATFVAGFVSLLLEVAWTRAVALIIGSSTYGFTLILFTFLLGIALGSLVMGRILRARGGISGTASLGVCFLIMAVAASLTLPLMKYAVFIFMKLMFAAMSLSHSLFVFQFGVCAALLLVPALMFGAAFPLAAELYSRHKNTISSSVGGVYFWNTLGAILGSSLTGFMFIPLMGVHNTLVFALMVALGAGVVLLLGDGHAALKPRLAGAAVGVAAVLLVVSTARWDKTLMSSGPFLYYESLGKSNTVSELHDYVSSKHKLLYYRDGITSTVTVRRTGERLYMQVNGKTDASNLGDAHAQIFASLAPLLIHKHPGEVAVIGIGSGMSAGVALQMPHVRHVDVIEIEPAVVDILKYFDKYNFELRKDKRASIFVEDGRNFLLRRRKKYDVIVSEPSNPWIAGIANLYTKDFFELSRKHLNPGGLFCQWIQFYNISPNNLRMIIATMQSVYPHMNAFIIHGDMFLIGAVEPYRLNGPDIARRFRESGIRPKLAPMKCQFNDLSILAGHYKAGPEELRKLSVFAQYHTDNRPLLEYYAPLDIFRDSSEIFYLLQKIYPVDVLKRLGFSEKELSADDYLKIAGGIMGVQHDQAWGDVEPFLLKALEKEPMHTESMIALARYYESNRMVLKADDYYEQALRHGADLELRKRYLQFLVRQKKYEKVIALFEKYGEKELDSMTLLTAGAAYRGLGLYDKAVAMYLQAADESSTRGDKSIALSMAAEILKQAKRKSDGRRVELLSEALSLSPTNAHAALQYADILISRNQKSEARKVLQQAFAAHPDNMEMKIKLMNLIPEKELVP